MIRFYGFTYKDLLNLPIRVFWAMNREIPRLRADEALALIPATAAAGMGAKIEELINHLRSEIGQPVESRVVRAAKSDIQRLRSLMGGGSL